ncbi:hypothetical protein D3C71_1684940 [compost metagenome]
MQLAAFGGAQQRVLAQQVLAQHRPAPLQRGPLFQGPALTQFTQGGLLEQRAEAAHHVIAMRLHRLQRAQVGRAGRLRAVAQHALGGHAAHLGQAQGLEYSDIQPAQVELVPLA